MPLFGTPDVDKLKTKKDVKGLVKLLGHKNAEIRRDAVTALGRIIGPFSSLDAGSSSAALDALARALGDQDAKVSSAAAAALGRSKDERAILSLGDLVRQGRRDAYIFDALFAALTGPRPGEAAIDAIAASKDPSVLERLLHRLEKLEREKTREAEEQFPWTEKALFALVESLGERAAEPLMARFSELSPKTRNRAVRALRHVEGEMVLAAYLLVLGDSDGGIRYEAATGLGRMKARSAADALAEALEDDDKSVRAAASSALAEIGDARATSPTDRIEALEQARDVEGLISALLDSNKEELRPRAAAALGRIGDVRAVEPLIEVFEEAFEVTGNVQPDGSVIYHKQRHRLDPSAWSTLPNWSGLRDQCAVALGQLGDARAVEPLVRALNMPTQGGNRVVDALHRLPPADLTSAIMDFLDAPRTQILTRLAGPGWSRALQVLGQVGDERAVNSVFRLLSDRSVSSHALEAMIGLLRRHAPDLSPELLRRAAEMSDGVQLRPVLDEKHDSVEDYELQPLDYSVMRLLAREELDRRGLT
jgi:HEAT repeat protein